MNLQLLRLAIEASIELALAEREEGADGYRRSARGERVVADQAWADLERSVNAEGTAHKQGCPALGGYGTPDRTCICGADSKKGDRT